MIVETAGCGALWGNFKIGKERVYRIFRRPLCDSRRGVERNVSRGSSIDESAEEARSLENVFR